MADSDEEYDRRRARDKFRRERSDYQERREERNRRDDWSERESWNRDRGNRREYRDYDPRNRRDRYSPARHDMSPPMKRMRREWDDRAGYGNFEMGYPGGGTGGGGLMGGHPGGWGGGMSQEIGMMHGQHGFGGPQGPQRDIEPGLTQPPMMTFKQFLASQDDGIDDQEAVKKYGEYKLEFKRQQINEFFLNHKEEEWFKAKFHPEESGKRKAEQHAALKRRLDAFLDLQEKSWISSVSLDADKGDQIIRILDAATIKLEGGTDNDLRVLDENYEEEKPKDPQPSEVVKKEEKNTEKKESEETPEVKEAKDKEKEKNRKRSRDYSYDENEETSAESESECEPAPPGLEDEVDAVSSEGKVVGETRKKRKKKTSRDSESKSDQEDHVEKDEKEPLQEEAEKKDEDNEDDDDEEEEEEEVNEDPDRNVDETNAVHVKVEPNAEDDSKSQNEEKTSISEDTPPKPRPLHRTCSIFLRNLAPSITKQEIEAICKKFNGFLRITIGDPQPDRRFCRRGWVTFERIVNIKEICWNLNNIRLRDCDVGAIVNRDIMRRIRAVNGITSHKQVVRSDIKLAARVIQHLDKKRSLWIGDEPKEEPEHQGFLLVSQNPLLKNITDYLIEEANAEEEELLGIIEEDENKEESESTLERDEVLIRVLDRLLLYLRIVHSVDYYNHIEYHNEDELPNRCGMMHVRGDPPATKVTQQEINDYISYFEQKAAPLLLPQAKLSEEDAVKLGKKDPEVEVEKFIQANTQELAKDKWLCPLSGKKFKGPEFVRKHIFNKHAEKVEEVKKEVEYFNNYLVDPKRPQLPEHPSNRTLGGGREMHAGMGPFHGGGFPHPPPYGAGFGPRGPPGGFQGGFGAQGYGGRNNFPDVYNRSGFGKRGNYGRNPRKIITYRDLDAPNDSDIF